MRAHINPSKLGSWCAPTVLLSDSATLSSFAAKQTMIFNQAI
jgi:hypothetical protein